MQRRIVAVLILFVSAAGSAQSTPPPLQRGWQISGLPALNFNADEGFGYGVIAQAYNYGNEGAKPYTYLIQPLLFLTTKGRRDLSVFVDAPHLLPGGLRLGAYLGREQQQATPYYGVGNTTTYDAAKELATNPYYYRYGRVGVRFNTDVQRPLIGPLRLLVGLGTRTSNIVFRPFNADSTLLSTQLRGDTIPHGQTSYVRAGLVYDTRDRETGPSRGQWLELLVQQSGPFAGGDYSFTRVTGTARAYVSLSDRLVFAERITFQNLWNSASPQVPFYELSTIQGSFSDGEGLGGAGSLRGWPKNRFISKTVLFANQELRWRVSEFSLLSRPSAFVLSGFVDAGRAGVPAAAADVISGLHVGFGGGARLRFGQDFVVGVDVGHSKESGAAIYIGLGYPY